MIQELRLTPVALQLEIPDDVVRKRAATAGRQSDQPKIIEQRIKDYHREMNSIAIYFPKAKIVSVDANKPEADVWQAIQAGLSEAGIKPSSK